MIAVFALSLLFFVGVSHAAHTGNFVPLMEHLEEYEARHNALLHPNTNNTTTTTTSLLWLTNLFGDITALLPPNRLTTARCMIYIIGMLAILYQVAPGFLFRMIHGGTHSPLNHRLVQTYSSGIASAIILMYCHVSCSNMTLVDAYPFSLLPWMLECIRNLLVLGGGQRTNKTAVRYHKSPQVLGLVLSALFLYAMTAHDGHPTAALQTMTTAWLVLGVAVIYNPRGAAKMLVSHHDMTAAWDATSQLMVRMIGFNMLAHGGVAAALLFGTATIADPLTAFGIGYSAWLWKIVFLQFVTGDLVKAGVDRRTVYALLALHGGVVATILFLPNNVGA